MGTVPLRDYRGWRCKAGDIDWQAYLSGPPMLFHCYHIKLEKSHIDMHLCPFENQSRTDKLDFVFVSGFNGTGALQLHPWAVLASWSLSHLICIHPVFSGREAARWNREKIQIK